MFDYLNYKNKIPLDKCVLKMPTCHPTSSKYEKEWIYGVKRKQIEGMWVSHKGEYKWIPGPIVQYTSMWTISMTEKGTKSKGKTLGKPRLRDLEWIKGYVHAVARGFSGFNGDDEYSCHRALLSIGTEDEEDILGTLEEHILETLKNSKGEYKKYIHALEYLYQYFPHELGKPLYLNEASNVVDIEARDMGKSMSSGNFCGHNLLTDGVMDFDEWIENYWTKPEGERRIYTSMTLVGAIQSKYSTNLMDKIEDGMNHFPKALNKIMSGTYTSGGDKVAEFEEKVGNNWIKKGSGSSYLHRVFKDSPEAANGTRYAFGVIDEVGLMGNLLAALGQLHDCTTGDRFKFGTIWMTGTGGFMDGGSTEQVKQVFYNPSSENCLEFDDIFENTNKKIGFFVPGWMAFDKFRDELGNVDKEKGIKQIMKERAVKAKSPNKQTLNDFLQMHPLIPSEAFLITSGNDFPVADLLQQLKLVEASIDDNVLGTPGRMVSNGAGFVFEPELSKRNLVLDYPIKKGENNGGMLVVWEHPDINSGYGYYVAGNDPYNQDKAPNSESVGSLFIMKRKGINSSPYDKIVAEYTARPDRADLFYEECRRILLWYNGICLYENNFNGLKTHFQYKNSLNLLAFAPGTLKANKEGLNNTIYGIRMSKELKAELIIYLRDWLTEKVDGEKMNLHYIYSKGLLKELISYNDEGNFDRVIALMLTVAQGIQMRRIAVETKKEIVRDPFFERMREMFRIK